jgi:tetratricopeptide (TPR) repeat protein
MQTASPFRALHPKAFIPRRYAPLLVTCVEDQVERLFRLCGLTFTDYFAALASTEPDALRFLPHGAVEQEPQEAFFGKVLNDVVLCSQSFVFPEYEDSDATNPQLSPFPERFPSLLRYPSDESRRPPWFAYAAERLLGSLQFSDFDFCDLPICVVYASLAGCPVRTADGVRQALEWPPWMREFVPDVPIVHVVLYDGLIVSQPPTECAGPRGSFDALYGLCFRTRRLDSPGALDPAAVRALFQYDAQLSGAPNFCGFLSQADIDAARHVLRQVAALARTRVAQLLRQYDQEIENAKLLSSRMKGLFGKKAPEKVSEHLGIPWRKLVHLRIAGIHMATHQYELARRSYKSFVGSFHEGQFAELRIAAQFMMGVAAVPTAGLGPFKEAVVEVLKTISQARSIRFLLMVPVLACEFHAAIGELPEAASVCSKAISRVNQLWSGNLEMKAVMLALLYERLAGLTQHPQRSALATARAALYYRQANQDPHALRCFIWLLRVLPTKSWVLLYQRVRLEKAIILCALKQWHRALIECKELLALPDLDWSLHERVISQFWSPYNDSLLPKDQLVVRVNSLLEVRSLTLTDKTAAQYWGFAKEEFATMIKEFDEWLRQQHTMKRDVSIDAWLDDEESVTRAIKTVGVGSEVLLTIGLCNRYYFSVHLDRAILRAEFTGEPCDGPTYRIDEVLNKGIPGSSTAVTPMQFKFMPLAAGRFVVNAFAKNYWGYVDTEIACGPLAFNAVTAYPQIRMEIVGFPETAFSGQCARLIVRLTNTGDSPMRGFALAIDHPDAFSCESGNAILCEGIFIVERRELIEVEQSVDVSLILRSGDPGIEHFHFFVSVSGLRCAFAVKKLVITKVAEFGTQCIAKYNDTSNNAYYCTVQSTVDRLEVIGVINRRNRVLKSMALPRDAVLSVGQQLSFVVLTADETAEEVEPWRSLLLAKGEIALLFRIEGVELPLQQNLVVDDRAPLYSLSLSIPRRSEVKLGTKLSCTVRLEGTRANDFELYVEPLPFMFCDINSNNRSESYVGCRWTGITRHKISSESDFKAQFVFTAYGGGIFSLCGFKVCQDQSFTNPAQLWLSQNIQIVPI